MKILNNCIIVLLLLACISCRKKEYPESTKEGSPVFNCTMSINGVPTSIEAGVNNYYMYSSFQQDSNNVYGFIAGLKQTDSTNSPNSLQIQINDYKISPANASTQIDSLVPKNYDYMSSTAASFYTAQFQSYYNKPASSYLWNFGDGATSTAPNPTHLYKRVGKYKVSLSVTGANSCVSSVSNFENIGILTSKFRTSIQADSGFGNLVNFSSINTQGNPNYLYLWNFGDGTAASTAANPSHSYQYTGSYPVTLRVIDNNGNGDTAYAKYNVVTQNDISSCTTNYTVNTVTFSPNTLGLSNIIVKWVDANGVEYTSKNTSQPNTSYFKIISVEDYQNNDNNQRTKKLHVKFKCTVYNGSSSIQLDNADAYINIAYK